MKLNLKPIGMSLLLITIILAIIAIALHIDVTFTIPFFIISILLILLDDVDLNEDLKLKPIRIKDKK